MSRFVLFTAILLTVSSFATANTQPLTRPPSDGLAQTILDMLSDGQFTPDEQSTAVETLKSEHVFGMAIEWEINSVKKSGYITCSGPNSNRLASLAMYFDDDPGKKIANIIFWRDPKPDVAAAAKKRAEVALKSVYKQLCDIKDSYEELELLDSNHVELSKESFVFAPVPLLMDRTAKNKRISFSIGAPSFVPTQIATMKTYFPKQKLVADRFVIIEDVRLRGTVDQILDDSIKPLVDAEKKLGGNPITVFN